MMEAAVEVKRSSCYWNATDNKDIDEPQDNCCPTAEQFTKSVVWSLNFLWKAAIHPLANSSAATLLLMVFSFCVAAEVLQHKLDGIDCDPGALGSFVLHVALIVVSGVLWVATSAIGFLGARERADALNKAKKEFDSEKSRQTLISLNGEEGTFDTEKIIEETPLPFNPYLVTFVSKVGELVCGLSLGALMQLLIAPTQLGGADSGCDVSALQRGSKEMWGGTAGSVAAGIINFALIYINKRNIDKVTSHTHSLELETADLDSFVDFDGNRISAAMLRDVEEVGDINGETDGVTLR